jgi:hypothetical protein
MYALAERDAVNAVDPWSGPAVYWRSVRFITAIISRVRSVRNQWTEDVTHSGRSTKAATAASRIPPAEPIAIPQHGITGQMNNTYSSNDPACLPMWQPVPGGW